MIAMDSSLDYLDDLLFKFRATNDFTRNSFTLMATVAFVMIPYYALKLLLAICQGFRLYVLSQFLGSHHTRKYGEWVVVTGATDGIGQSMAREFARRGHSIIVVGRNGQKLASTKTLLESEPNVGQVETIKIDLSDSSLANYEPIKSQLNADNRDIGILVNNAGVATDKFVGFADFDMDKIRCQVNVNVLATAYFTRLIMPGMLARQRGLIMNVSSLMGEIETGYTGVYAATKSFINSFSRALKFEYSSYPIDIINLTPSTVSTKMMSSLDFTRRNILMPSSDYYARSAINAAKTRIDSYCGCWSHGLSRLGIKWFEPTGIAQSAFKISIRWKNPHFIVRERNLDDLLAYKQESTNMPEITEQIDPRPLRSSGNLIRKIGQVW